MAKSLDRLIDFLLEEIALDGVAGISIKQLVAHVERFYDHPELDSSGDLSDHNVINFRVDKTFLRKLWRWLSVHEDIFIGRDNEYKDVPFDEIATKFPNILAGVIDNDVAAPVEDEDAIVRDEHTITPDDDHSVDVNEIEESLALTRHPPRIYVSEESVYYAICGHAHDPSRVFPTEWDLLCCIASTRHDGILQGPLGQRTGQDKRSVPKRTEALRDKGYIVKKKVNMGGHETSRLWLRKFADLRRDDAIRLKHIAKRPGYDRAAKAEMLSRIIQHLIDVCCLVKHRTAFAPDAKAQDVKVYIQSPRNLQDQDLAFDEDTTIDFEATEEDFVAMIRATMDLDDLNAAIQETAEMDAADDAADQAGMPRRPQWNPDRVIPNVLHDFADRRGELGITNVIIRKGVTGLSVRRPMESILVRLSHNSLKSQPVALKDLAIVRISELARSGVNVYIHRSFNTFQRMVDESIHFWSAVNGGKDILALLKDAPSGKLEDTLSRDEHGMYTHAKPKGQISGGSVGQAEL
ncbi:hypothetical protein LTR66_017515, partial [Elasticomyces elasticus]